MIIPKLQSFRIPYWAIALLLFVLAVLTFYILARFKIPIDGAGSKIESESCIITAIRSGSPAEKAGLIEGDIIKYIGLKPISGKGHTEMLEPYRPDDTLDYIIIRDDEKMVISVTLDSFWSQNPRFYFALYLLMFVVCTTSIYILYKKPYDLTARLFFIYLQLLAIAQNLRFLFLDDFYSLIATVAFIFSFNLFGVVLLHFHLVFPKPVPFYHRIKGLLKGIYLLGVLIGVGITGLLISRNYSGSFESHLIFEEYCRWSVTWMGLTLVLALGVAIHQFINSKGTHTRRQLRLVLIGSAFGLLTPILFGIFPEYIWQLERELHFQTTLELTNGVGTYIMTSFLVIAIFRYRIWNIELFVRRAMLYGAATIIIYIFYIGLIYLVDLFLKVETRLVHYLILAASSFIFLLLRDNIQRLIDRFFHRESYNSTKVVTEFEEKLSGIYQIDVLNSALVKCLQDIFLFKSFVFVMREHSLRYKVLQLYGLDDYSIKYEFEITNEIDELIRKSKIFSTEELGVNPTLFKVAKGELIVPLMAGNQPFGFFIFGPKLSEKSYSLQDIRVLSLLARRVNSLFHTARLYQKDLDRQLMLEHERTRIAKDIHDDVGASLTRICIMSEQINNNSAPAHIKKWLDKISLTSREVTQEMNQIIWALNPKNNSIEGLIAYIRRYTSEYLESASLNYSFDLPEKIPGLDLSVEAQRNIYLSVKEVLHNVVKHADAMKVDISLNMIKHGFIIIIKDDGNGFNPCKVKEPGNGLGNMKKRMRSVGGKLSVRANPGQGTSVSLFIPEITVD